MAARRRTTPAIAERGERRPRSDFGSRSPERRVDEEAGKRQQRNQRDQRRVMRHHFNEREGVGVERFAVAEQRDDDRQADRGFGGGHGHDEEHDDLPVDGAERAAERHERQVHAR